MSISMVDGLGGVSPSEIRFIQRLKLSDYSAVFHVIFRNQECVMKVYHEMARTDCDPPDREISLFVREATAYQRLKAKGFCKRGIIPDFYGTIRDIQPALWPCLDMFLNDEIPPNAVLIEYIPGMREIDLSNFSEERIAKLRRILDSMHRAKVEHGDPFPRNMMIQAGKYERVLWIDFDRANTFPEDVALTPRQKEWVAGEEEMMNYFAYALTQDHKGGKLRLAYSYYYEWFATPP